MAEKGKAFPGSLGNTAKGALLTISKKEKKKRMALEDGKKRPGSFFWGSKSPYALVL